MNVPELETIVSPATDRVARTLSAWSVTSKAAIAAMTVLRVVLAGVTGPRIAIAIARVVMLTTPLMLCRRSYPPLHERKPDGAAHDTPQPAPDP